MEGESTRAALARLFTLQTGIAADAIVDDARLTDLGADSLGLVEICVEVEDRWGFRFANDQEFLAAESFGAAVTLVDQYREAVIAKAQGRLS